MKNLIETIDLQRWIRKNAFKKACELFGELNKARWGFEKATSNQIMSVYRLAYNKLSANHQRTKWLNPIENPKWITKLDYICARGGKKIAHELNEIIKTLSNDMEEE